MKVDAGLTTILNQFKNLVRQKIDPVLKYGRIARNNNQCDRCNHEAQMCKRTWSLGQS